MSLHHQFQELASEWNGFKIKIWNIIFWKFQVLPSSVYAFQQISGFFQAWKSKSAKCQVFQDSWERCSIVRLKGNKSSWISFGNMQWRTFPFYLHFWHSFYTGDHQDNRQKPLQTIHPVDYLLNPAIGGSSDDRNW